MTPLRQRDVLYFCSRTGDACIANHNIQPAQGGCAYFEKFSDLPLVADITHHAAHRWIGAERGLERMGIVVANKNTSTGFDKGLRHNAPNASGSGGDKNTLVVVAHSGAGSLEK